MAKERDNKGRFVKGQKPPVGNPISEGTAREMQLRSAEARKDNRIVADAIRRAILGKNKETGNPVIDDLVNNTLERMQKGGSMGDLRAMADVLGELEQKVTENITMEMKFKFGDE
jgi:hypothetical protein